MRERALAPGPAAVRPSPARRPARAGGGSPAEPSEAPRATRGARARGAAAAARGPEPVDGRRRPDARHARLLAGALLGRGPATTAGCAVGGRGIGADPRLRAPAARRTTTKARDALGAGRPSQREPRPCPARRGPIVRKLGGCRPSPIADCRGIASGASRTGGIGARCFDRLEEGWSGQARSRRPRPAPPPSRRPAMRGRTRRIPAAGARIRGAGAGPQARRGAGCRAARRLKAPGGRGCPRGVGPDEAEVAPDARGPWGRPTGRAPALAPAGRR